MRNHFFVAIIASTTSSRAQDTNIIDCPVLQYGHEHLQKTDYQEIIPQSGGVHVPPTGNVRALFIFARFSDDNFEVNNSAWKISDSLTTFYEDQDLLMHMALLI
jgi:hypothetical protein